MATTMPRNYLIHTYRERDNLVPFECEDELCTFRDTVKAAIWARTAQIGLDRDLVIKDWSFRRLHGQTAEHLEGLGIIYCTTEARQNMVMSLIGDILLTLKTTPSSHHDGNKTHHDGTMFPSSHDADFAAT
jgi:hypothetical protein